LTKICLVRHAVAEKRDPARWPDDSLRPLTPEGIARFRSAARGLGRIVSTVELFLSSSYTRSWETAELLREVARWPAPERCRQLEADQTPGAALHALQTRSKPSSLALVGHEPNLSSLASLLLTGHEDALELELKKGAVVFVEIQADVPPGTGVLRWSVSPKILRALDPSA
jgi:phosphohistidine phosphatase